MEFFADGLVVRLRSRIRGGLYVYARDHGFGVRISPRRSSPNTAWEVLRFQREGTECFLLRSSATGRCLAAAESDDQRSSSRRAAAVQRGYVEGPQFQRALGWRAIWAGRRHGDVVLRDFFLSRKLCAEAEASDGNGVFVELGSRGKNERTATASASHWFLEAALPFFTLRPAPNPPATGTCLCVPRLNRDTAASACLPILGMANELVSYVPVRSITGLLQLLDGAGGGEMLWADTGAVGGAASSGQRVIALAFVAGRGKGITALPLHLLGKGDAGAVLDGGEPGANDDVVVGADDDPVQEQHQPEEYEALEDGGGQQEHLAQDELDLQQQVAQQIDDKLSLLGDAYQVMESKHRQISRLVQQRRIAAEEAAARRDWTGADKLHRALQNSIQQALRVYDGKAKEAAGFRDSLVRLGVRRPPSPPPLLRTHPAQLLTGRRG